MWTGITAVPPPAAKMIKEAASEIKRGCVMRIHANFWGCLLGILSARIVRGNSGCFRGCLLPYDDGAGIVPREEMQV